jgi:putative tryptophan/tyrosine transport system substrate-binding protein
MRRRDFFVAAAMLAPLMRPARAQKAALTTKRLAWVSPNAKLADMSIGGDDPNAAVFPEELKRLGYVEGQNLIIERYTAEGHKDRYGDLAREIVGTRPDVIWALGTLLTREFKAATSTIPVVAFTGDPVRFGFISSLAHPGGNITGVSADAGLEIWGKRLELLLEAVPNISRVAFISSPSAWENPGGRSVQEVARSRGILVRNAPVGTVRDEAEYRRVLSSIQQDQVDGIAFAEETEAYAYRFLLVQLVEQARIPAIYVYRDQTEAGGLMSYSYDIKGAIRTNARQIVDILRGASPSEMPYEQASRFELVINLKTAKALGLKISTNMLARADAVIE